MTFARFLRIARQRLRTLFRSGAVDRELDRELAFHLEALAAEARAGGRSDDEARRVAARTFGNVAVVGEACRDTRRLGWVDDLRRDVVYGLRRLRAERGLTAAIVVSLALGIGLETTVLRAVDAALVERLSLAHADRYVSIRETEPAANAGPKAVTAMEFARWRDRTSVFDAIGASAQGARTLGGEPGFPPERLHGLAISAGALGAMGARPLLGREFSAGELRLVNPVPAAIISFDLWQRRFHGDPVILSRHMRVDGIDRAIVGVMPADMRYEDLPIDCWLPLRLLPDLTWGVGRSLRVTAHLAPGVSPSAAVAALEAVDADLARSSPAVFSGWHPVVEPLEDVRLGWARRPLAAIGLMATLVLLVACVNVGGLLFARGAARDRDMDLRLALGASRGRLVRQWLTEGLLFGSLGGAASLAVTAIGLRAMAVLPPPPGMPPIRPLGLDWQTMALTVVVSFIAGVVPSIAPALAATSRRSSRRASRWRPVFTAVEIAVTFAVVVASTLLGESVMRLAHRDLHFAPDHLLNIEVSVPETREGVGTDATGAPLFEIVTPAHATLVRLGDAFRHVPGVAAVGGSTFRAVDAFVVNRPAVTAAGRPPLAIATSFVTPGYFEAMETPLVRGRAIAASDTEDAAWVVIVNEAAARTIWPGRDALGQSIRFETGPDERPRTVVGIVRDIPLGHAALAPEPIIYASYSQEVGRVRGLTGFGNMTFVARFTGGDEETARAIRQAAAVVVPDLPLGTVATAGRQLEAGRAELAVVADAALALGAIGILLALIGIHGVTAFRVARARRDIAIRRSLGARGRDVTRAVAAGIAVVTIAGLLGGFALALVTAYRMAPYLWGLAPTDPTSYAVAVAVVVGATVVACGGPLRKALAVDPASVLRGD